MAYATEQDIIDRYGEDFLTTAIGHEDENGDFVYSSDTVSKALTSASELIDSYAAKQYITPLPQTAITEFLKTHCFNIAIYQMIREGTDTELIKDRYEDAMRYLMRLSKGDVQLTAPENSGAAPQEQSDNNVQISSKPRRFERGGDL